MASPKKVPSPEADAILKGLKQAREAAGWTQEEAGPRAATTGQTVYNWEKGDGLEAWVKRIRYLYTLASESQEARRIVLGMIGIETEGISTDPELDRRIQLLRAAYQQDSPIVRSLLTSLEVALQEGGGPPAIERRHRSRPPGEATPPASDEGAVSRS